MTATQSGKCPNVIPMGKPEVHGHLRYATCPECGGYFIILASGRFRTHKPPYKPGDPRIAERIAEAREAAER